jgi:glucose-6-phosphate 1-dehydrogenase
MDQGPYDFPVAASKYLQTCDVLIDDFKVEPFTIVIFSDAGDLSKRMLLPSLYRLHRDGRLPQDFSVVGFGLPEMSDEKYRNFTRQALEQVSGESFSESDCDEFSRHLFYISGDFSGDEGYKALYNRVGEICVPTPQETKELIFYLAVPPVAAPANFVRSPLSRKSLWRNPLAETGLQQSSSTEPC